jgi:hypothetical protein
MFRRALLSMLAITCITAIPTPSHAGSSARLHVQVPFDYNNPNATSLSSVEGYGNNPYISRSFEIPYGLLETQIEKALEDAIDSPVTGSYDLPDPAPILDYKIKIDPKVKFTKKNQPTFTTVGPASDATFDVKLDTRVRAEVKIDVHAEVGPETIDVPLTAHVEINATGKVRMKLWPTISAEDVDVEFSLHSSNIDLELNGIAMELGAKVGVVVGLSPAGIFGGGLLLGPFAAIVANEAADIAEREINKAFNKELKKLVPKYGSEVEKKVKAELDPAIAAADAVKDKALAKQVPGTGKTVQQLLADLGAAFEVQVATPTDDLAVAATLRMSGAAAGGKMTGKIRIPKKECTYAYGNDNGWLKGAKIPLEMVPTNGDLDRKVGRPCSEIVQSSGLTRQLYLGANPRTAIGTEAEARTTWKAGGDLDMVGNLTETDEYYECRFEIDELPKATILSLESAGALKDRLNEEQFRERMMVLSTGPVSVVLDRNLDPWAAGGVVIGGAGECHGSGGGGKALTPNQMQELLDKLDPDKCPSCGLEKIPGTQDWRINDPAAFEKSAIGSKVKGLSAGAVKMPKTGPAVGK